jgi:hypothetical protein
VRVCVGGVGGGVGWGAVVRVSVAGSPSTCNLVVALPAQDAAEGRQLAVTVTSFSASCGTAVLVLRNGTDPGSPVLVEFCSKTAPFTTMAFPGVQRCC